jgi:uncharacterized membrane protein
MPSIKPITTTLIGGLVFLLPLIVVVVVIGQGLALTARAVQPVVALLPNQSVGGVTLASVAGIALLMLICFGAGVLARAAAGRAFAARFEARLQALYPRYAVVKSMSQGLQSAAGKQVLKPVLVSFDDHQQFAFDIERLDDGRVVVYVPGAPDAWSGGVLLVSPERVAPLALDAGDLAKAMQGLGVGTAALLRGPAGAAQASR